MSGKSWIGLGIAIAAVILLAVVNGPFMAERGINQNKEELACLDCHRQANINTNEGVAVSQAFCNRCHLDPDCKKTVAGSQLSLTLKNATLMETPHRSVACISCHTDVARSPHRTETGAVCLQCHDVHGETAAHAPHLRVDCQACHFTSDAVRLDPSDHRIKLARLSEFGKPVERTDHSLAKVTDPQSCRRCHNNQNELGAPAAILPAKSFLCIVCHPSGLTVGHPIFWIAAVLFLSGVLFTFRFWFIGRVQGEERSLGRKIGLVSESIWDLLFSRKFFTLAKILLMDILLQRRILKESVQRWSMHSLIYLAIVARLALSLLTGFLFSVDPDCELALMLIDKNHPATAFTYDLLGMMIFIGILWAALQRFYIKPAHVKTEIEDNITLMIVGILVILGFLSTGARILLTQIPAEVAVYSFVGYPISKVIDFLPVDWRTGYVYLWYAHAVFGALFLAYLPYGKLKHIFNVPLTYVLEEIFGVKKEKRV